MNALTTWNEKQIALIRKTVAKDCDPHEFDQFIHICRAVRLDPLRRQIFCFIFHKQDPSKRQMTIVTSIGGYRSIAERTGAYRPDEQAPRYTMGDKSATNPLGIERCEVTVYKHSHGAWFPVVGEAWWDEYVPLNYEKTGIDHKKQGWLKMPRIMIAKCAEANALRKAWPDDFAMLYAEEEMDRTQVLDLTATEIADNADADSKLALVGGKNALTIDWCDGGKLARVPEGQFSDAVLRWTMQDRCATELRIWFQRNEAARAEFKARHGGEYLEFMKAFERRLAELDAVDALEAAE